MSLKENSCKKFQANIFNKSKCQNCFKPRETHSLNDEDLNQAKPIFGGWLLLAPEGTNFDNPLHRSRKWQRRFFILYEHGLLRYALDEMPSTLPQGTINMNQCSDVIDGESRTGQKNSLWILTPEKEYFIRAECKEIINGWQEALTVYPRTNKQNQKKKRKVDPPNQQEEVTTRQSISTEDMNGYPEPGPAKVTVTSSGSGVPCPPSSIPSAQCVPISRAILWQEESHWSRATIPCSRSASCLSQLSQPQVDSPVTTQDDGGTLSTGRKVRVESGYFSLEKTKSEPSSQSAHPHHPPQHLPLSSTASSSSAGASSCRYSPESEALVSSHRVSQDPLPSSSGLISPNYSTISSSQSSLDSDTSRATLTCEENHSCEGLITNAGVGGGRVGRFGKDYAALSDVPRARRLSYREAFRSDRKRQELRARTRSPGREEVARLFGDERRKSQGISQFEDNQHLERMDTCGLSNQTTNPPLSQRVRSERSYLETKQEMSLDSGKDLLAYEVSSYSFANLRRTKSLDRRITESSVPPDLLNFKKGWMTKLYEDGVWKKHWFVLTDQSLKYYKDSIAEEASEMDGEIDLSACYDVKEFPVQRNYGFQILCKEGACTLSAMTSGIRRNWIQAIMKNVRPTIAPDVTRSLPDENGKSHEASEPCPQITSEPSPHSELSKSDGYRQAQVSIITSPTSEPRKSRARERRREGRSKTYDWAEFKMEPKEKPLKERADTVDLSSSCSTASSRCSLSSSASSLASSPVSSSSLQTSGSGAVSSQEKGKENVLSDTTTLALSTKPASQPSDPDNQELGRMELDHPNTICQTPDDRTDGRSSDVKEEIEHRWHQVETTPLREERQVPIASTVKNSDRLPAHELATLLDKELGQKQKELEQLQEQNSILKEKLENALGREQSAREGYILQSATSPSSSPCRVPWQHLHKLSQDLQGELESQKLKQDHALQQIRILKRSYTEAQDAVNRHETDIQGLQAKLASAMAEILVGEQAVARMRNELKLEQERSKDQEEVYGRIEATLRTQLKDSEDRLRQVEANLLERNQALRHLEHQQALQRDHVREIQRLQEKLQEVTARLSATEECQTLKEQRLKKEKLSMQENHERERQSLCRRLDEAEAAQKDTADRLLEAEQQVEALLRGSRASGEKEMKEDMLKLQEHLALKTDMVESLRESVRRLEEEKGHLTCRCQELHNQITETDREVHKLRNRLENEEADYCTLEQSYDRATQEFKKISHILIEKEEEIRQTKEMYERLMERKEEDLREALVKMSVLGNSLEETEQKLQAKEELLCQISESLIHKSEHCEAEKDLQTKLVVAEDRIAELELHLKDLELDYADLHKEKEKSKDLNRRGNEKASSLSLNMDMVDNESTVDDKESQPKRQRIRFSNIQCQKYTTFEEMNTSILGSHPVENKDRPDENGDHLQPGNTIPHDVSLLTASDPEKFISIIQALEAKLLATEGKLRHFTQNLEVQQYIKPEYVGIVDPDITPSALEGCDNAELGHLSSAEHFTVALVCIENSREKVNTILRGSNCYKDSYLHLLSEIENKLFNASLHIQQGQQQGKQENQVTNQPDNLSAETINTEELQHFTQTLSYEAAVLNKMAALIQTSKPELLQALVEMWEDIDYAKRSDKSALDIVYADVLTRKLLLETTYWKRLETAGVNVGKTKENDTLVDVDDPSVVFNSMIKAELAYSIQNLKLCYEEKFQTLKRELREAHRDLKEREMALESIIDASKRPDLTSVIEEVKSDLRFSRQRLADIHPPELAPYMEQLKMDVARDMAEEVVGRQLTGVISSCDIETIKSFERAYDGLVDELQRQAVLLEQHAVEMRTGSYPALSKMVQNAFGAKASYRIASTSLCIRDALVQAQVAYLACRLHITHEQDVSQRKETSQNMEALVQQHAHSMTAIQTKYEARLEEERQKLAEVIAALEKENEMLKNEITEHIDQLLQHREQVGALKNHFLKETEELKQKHKEELSQLEQCHVTTELSLIDTAAESQRKLEVVLTDMNGIEECHQGHLRDLETQFELKMRELQQNHKAEIEKLHFHHDNAIQCAKKSQMDPNNLEVLHWPPPQEGLPSMEEERMDKQETEKNTPEVDSMTVLKERIQELETQMDSMRDELESKHLEGDVATLKEKYQRDFESLKATCERGFAAMEETHQKVVEDLLRQHQREISKLMEERERLLAEETAATIAAIEAMKNAHKEELEKTQRSQLSGLNSDIDELRLQYQEELQSIQRELEVLSEQYSQKCLENAHLAQALEAERQALTQCQRENQELNSHNQELNNRLAAEITRMRSCFSGETALSPLSQGKDVYELEVLLRIKESEIQYLKQEIHSLKDELQSALRDKKYATDKYKDIYTELSIVKAKADCDISKLKERLLIATEALGERSVEGSGTTGYDIMKSKSNPDFMKKERPALPKQSRSLRSKSLKEGLTVQERLKLFEAKDPRKI